MDQTDVITESVCVNGIVMWAVTAEALAIEVDQGIKGEQVVEAMTRIVLSRGAPHTIRVDNGPESPRKRLTDGRTRTA